MKIGVLGGTFDPVHNAHIAIANEAVKQLLLDEVIFIPAWSAPHKTDNLSAIGRACHRLKMLELVLEDYDNFFVSDIEIKRKGISYTYDTLEELKKTYDNRAELFLLIGSDNYLIFDKWRNFEKIHEVSTVVVYKRPGSCPSEIKPPFKVLEGKELEITSTLIREKVANGESVSQLVPAKVEDYIITNNLYKE